MVYFFVLGVQFLAELKVSLRRIDDFLSMPEPPPPTHQRHLPAALGAGGSASATASNGSSSAARGASKQLPASTPSPRKLPITASSPQPPAESEQPDHAKRRLSLDVLFGRRPRSRASCDLDPRTAAEAAEAEAVPVGGLRLGGVDYEWTRNVEQMGLQPPPAAGSESSSSGSDDGDGDGDGWVEGARDGKGEQGGEAVISKQAPRRRCTLEGVRLDVSPGELLGICGEVGAGKSSVLAALLGELQPLRAADGSVRGGPVVRGSVAYCSQVPWIVAGSLRENILFGRAMEQERWGLLVGGGVQGAWFGGEGALQGGLKMCVLSSS